MDYLDAAPALSAQEGSFCRKAVFYASRTGTAKRYASWLCGMRDLDLYEVSQAKLTLMKPYGTFLFILCIYEGRMDGLDRLVRIYPSLMKINLSRNAACGEEGAKRVGILAVGAAAEEQARENGELSVPSVLENVPVFYARGRWQPETFGWKEKMTVDLYRKALDAEKAGGPRASVPDWARPLLLEHVSRDFTDKVFLDPVLDFLDGRD